LAVAVEEAVALRRNRRNRKLNWYAHPFGESNTILPSPPFRNIFSFLGMWRGCRGEKVGDSPKRKS
jgi:hypothetical protein